jgi:hypothetical protein
MQGILRAVGFLALSLIVGEIVKRLLTSRVGEATMTKLGRPEMATLEGATAASKEAKKAVGMVKSLTAPKPPTPPVVALPPSLPTWVTIARDAAEMLLAAGTVLRTASDFVLEDEKLRSRVARLAARR